MIQTDAQRLLDRLGEAVMRFLSTNQQYGQVLCECVHQGWVSADRLEAAEDQCRAGFRDMVDALQCWELTRK